MDSHDDRRFAKTGGDSANNADLNLRPPAKQPAHVVTLFTANNLIEDYCAIGDPMILEMKGKRLGTLFRGAKSETITTNITGKKTRLEVLPGTSFLIVDTPKDFTSAGFEFNSPMNVKFLYGGSVYAFKTAIMLVHTHPPVLALEYPNQEQRYNMRNNDRLPIVTPAIVYANGGSDGITGAVINLSATGALVGLKSAAEISAGKKLKISFVLPSGAEVSQIAAVVRNVSQQSGNYLLGTSFEKQDPVVDIFCTKLSNIMENLNTVTSDEVLGLGKSAEIEFMHKIGKVTVRGWKSGEHGFLLTDKPQGPMPPLTAGDQALIHEVHKGALNCMAVTYKGSLKKTDLCHFTFNDEAVVRPLRAGERFLCLIPATVNHAESRSEEKISCVIVNLGQGGLRFLTGTSLYAEMGDIMNISFHLGGIGFVTQQKIRLMRTSRHGSWFEYAAQSMEMNEENMQRLNSYFEFHKIWAVLGH